MLLFASSLLSVSSSIPTVTLSPSNALILRTPCLIPRHCLPSPLPLSSPKPISRNTLTWVLGDSPLTQQHVYPEFETQKFKVELLQKLSKDVDEFGDDLDAVVDVCAQIFSEFLCKEYGGPGTLLVEPFTDMLVALKKKKLTGAPLAARASPLWTQNHVDEDWETWHSKRKCLVLYSFLSFTM